MTRQCPVCDEWVLDKFFTHHVKKHGYLALLFVYVQHKYMEWFGR